MGSATLILSGTVVGLPSGQQVVSVQWALPNAVGEIVPVTLAIGNNLINVPSGAATVLIQPPDGNSVVITMKRTTGVGDLGLDLHPGLPAFVSLNTTMVSFYLTISSLLSGPVQISFW